MFSCMKYLMASLSLLTFGWAAELTPVGSAEELIDGHGNSAGFISAAAIAEISPEVAERASSTEYATLDTVFERIITLGSDCLPKGQINKFFVPERKFNDTKKGHGDLFDWMLMENYNLLAEALENNLTDFFEREDLSITTFYPVSTKYEMHWLHMFHEANERAGWISRMPHDKKSQVDFLDQEFPKVKEKMNYLRDKFISAKDKKTLYVIHEKKNLIERETLSHLRDSLKSIRQENKDFAILFVTTRERFSSFDNILVRESTKVMPGGWDHGDPVRWREILDEFKFTPDIWA